MSLAENDDDDDDDSSHLSDPRPRLPPPAAALGEEPENEEILEKDLTFCPPIFNVSEIMKKELPKKAKISQESKELVQESVSEFIRFITWKANQKLLREQAEERNKFEMKQAEERKKAAIGKRKPKELKTLQIRKTLNGDDILHAMTTLGFDDYDETLRNYLREYREMDRRKKDQQKQEQLKIDR